MNDKVLVAYEVLESFRVPRYEYSHVYGEALHPRIDGFYFSRPLFLRFVVVCCHRLR